MNTSYTPTQIALKRRTLITWQLHREQCPYCQEKKYGLCSEYKRVMAVLVNLPAKSTQGGEA